MSTTTRTGDYDHCAYVHEKVGIRCGGYRKGHEERYVDHPFTEAATLPPEQPTLTEAEAQLVIGAIPLQALPEQPAREGDEWRVVKTIPERETSDVELYAGNEGLIRLPWRRQAWMEQVCRDHARAALVPGLVAALVALEPYLSTEAELLDYASLNEGRASGYDTASMKARRALAAARKAGVE